MSSAIALAFPAGAVILDSDIRRRVATGSTYEQPSCLQGQACPSLIFNKWRNKIWVVGCAYHHLNVTWAAKYRGQAAPGYIM